MARLCRQFLALAALLSTCWVMANGVVNGDLVISKSERTIDATSHLVKIKTIFTVENTGTKAADHVHFVLDSKHADSLAYIGAVMESQDGESEDDIALRVVPEEAGKSLKDGSLYSIQLTSPLATAASVELTVETVFADLLEAHPSQITQSEKQLVRYRGSHYIYSPYKIKSQSTTVKLASSSVIQYSKQLQPVKQSDSTIDYGPYDDIDAFTKDDKLVVHYEHNGPFLTVIRMERAIEVSHWGNIAVEETYHMRHTGAILKGPFSRYDYQRNPTASGTSSIRNFKTLLPASATDVYYRDEIGNISTSHMLPKDDAVELEITPRFPLFGGWQTEYYMGYNVPSYEYLYYSGSHYKLKMRVVDHIYDDQCVQDFLLQIILPERASNIKFSAPFSLSDEQHSLHFTYLDIVGRPVVTVRGKNLVEQHIQEFELDYDFHGIFLLQEPLLVVLAFYLLFTFVIAVARMDFSITTDAATEARLKAASHVEHVESLVDQVLATYGEYSEALDTLKTSRDTKKFQNTKKQLDGRLKTVAGELPEVEKELRLLDADAADKVHKLGDKFRDYLATLKDVTQFTEQLVNDKMKKEVFFEREKSVKQKQESIVNEIQALQRGL